MARTQRLSRVIWGVFASLLIGAGFACDGTTEVGHHFFLICGGIAIGYGVAKNGTPSRGFPRLLGWRRATVKA